MYTHCCTCININKKIARYILINVILKNKKKRDCYTHIEKRDISYESLLIDVFGYNGTFFVNFSLCVYVR